MKKPASWFVELKARTWALYYACRDRETPWYAKAWAALVVAYAFSPLDLIPDFIPLLGLLDDAVLIPLGIALAIRLIPRHVMERSLALARARQASRDRVRGPGRWLVTGAIALVWAGVLVLVGRWVYGLLTRH